MPSRPRLSKQTLARPAAAPSPRRAGAVAPGERPAGEGRPRRSPATGAARRAYSVPTVSELPARFAEPEAEGDETW